VESRNLSPERANPEPTNEAPKESALSCQCSNAGFQFLNGAHRLYAVRIDHLGSSFLYSSE
jgi:hypothetical protein